MEFTGLAVGNDLKTLLGQFGPASDYTPKSYASILSIILNPYLDALPEFVWSDGSKACDSRVLLHNQPLKERLKITDYVLCRHQAAPIIFTPPGFESAMEKAATLKCRNEQTACIRGHLQQWYQSSAQTHDFAYEHDYVLVFNPDGLIADIVTITNPIQRWSSWTQKSSRNRHPKSKSPYPSAFPGHYDFPSSMKAGDLDLQYLQNEANLFAGDIFDTYQSIMSRHTFAFRPHHSFIEEHPNSPANALKAYREQAFMIEHANTCAAIFPHLIDIDPGLYFHLNDMHDHSLRERREAFIMLHVESCISRFIDSFIYKGWIQRGYSLKAERTDSPPHPNRHWSVFINSALEMIGKDTQIHFFTFTP